MCFFHYPAPKPRHKKAKKQAGLRRAVGGEVVHDVAYEAAGDALHQEAAGVGGAPAAAAMMYQPYLNHLPYGVEQYLQDEAGHAARGARAAPGEALDRALGAAEELGKKVEELKGVVAGGVADAAVRAGGAQDALQRTRDEVHHAHAAVQGVDDALRQTHRAIDKHYLEHSTKQDQCAAEITKVRTMLEEEARNKERKRQRQQDMQEAWNYYYQWFRQAEHEAQEKKSSSKSSSSSSNSSSSGSSRSGTSSNKSPSKKKTTSYGRQTTSTLDDLLYTSSGEARQIPDHRKLRRSVLECLNQILGEAGARADRPEQDRQSHHNHFHAHAPAASPPWAAQYYYYADPRGGSWEQQQRPQPHPSPRPQGSAPFPARDDNNYHYYYYNNNNYDGNGDPGKTSSLRYHHQNNPFTMHSAGWGGRGPSYH
ncbi:hypothetical protein F4811DRAFT_197666 [Daldinia bambusicola]|nr:hypothetical protein F4811DRAFT_197666 [Daldinia bambusicola]